LLCIWTIFKIFTTSCVRKPKINENYFVQDIIVSVTYLLGILFFQTHFLLIYLKILRLKVRHVVYKCWSFAANFLMKNVQCWSYPSNFMESIELIVNHHWNSTHTIISMKRIHFQNDTWNSLTFFIVYVEKSNTSSYKEIEDIINIYNLKKKKKKEKKKE
jgi:hypothetical protein